MTSAPITADAATAKVVGVGKTVTYKAGATVKKVTVKNKKVVKATIAKKNKKNVTLKGLKAGKTTVTVKTSKKTVKLTVKVGATSITKKTVATSMTAGQKKTLSVNAVNGKGDTIQFTSSNKSIVKVNKASAKATAKKVASTTVTAVKAGTAKITAKSKYTGKSKTFTIKVAAATVTPTPVVTTNAAVTTTPAATATVTNAPSTGGDTTKAPTTTSGAATTAPTENPEVTSGAATATPTVDPDKTNAPTAPATTTPEVTSGAATATPEVTSGAATATPAVTSSPGITTASAVSASALNAKTIAVSFNKALTAEEKAKIVATVKNNTVEASTVSTFKDDKTLYITKADESVFTAATYTVYVTGLAEEFSQSVDVEARKIASIKITNDQLIKTSDTTAIFYYTITDQYGVDYTADITDASITKTTSYGTTVELDPATGKGTVTASTFTGDTVPANVVVSLIDAATGANATKSLKVSAAATLKSFALGETSLPTGKTRIYVGQAEAAKVAINAVDTYGNVIKSSVDLKKEIELISSDTKAKFDFVNDENGNAYISVDTSDMLDATKVTLTTVVKATGDVQTKTFDVVKTAEPTTIEFGNVNQEVVAAGETAYIDIVVKNQFGDVMAPADYVNAGIVPAGTGALSGKVVIETEAGSNYGKVKLTPEASATAGNATITLTVGSKNFTKTVEVKAKRALTTVIAPKTISLVQGANTDLKFTFKDQYGQAMETLANDSDATTTYKITITKASGEEDGLTLTAPVSAEGADESNLNTITVAAADNKAGVYNVKVALLKDNKETSNATVKVTVLSDVATGLTYSVEDIALVPSAADTNNSVYAKDVVVKGKTAEGTEVILPSSLISSVELVDNTDNYFGVDKSTSTVFVADSSKDIPTAAKVKVTLNVSTGLQTVYSNVLTSSKEAPKAVELSMYKLADNVTDLDGVKGALGATIDTGVTELKEGATPVSSITIADDSGAGMGTTPKVVLVQKDQYGVYKLVVNKDIVINSKGLLVTGATANFANSTGLFTLSSATAGAYNKEITMSVQEGDATKVFKVTLADKSYIPTAEVTGNVAEAGKVGNGKKMVVTFSNALTASSQAKVIDAVKTAIGTKLDGTNTKATVAFDGDGKILTITAGDLSEAVTFAGFDITKTLVVDIYGNTLEENVTVTAKTA